MATMSLGYVFGKVVDRSVDPRSVSSFANDIRLKVTLRIGTMTDGAVNDTRQL